MRKLPVWRSIGEVFSGVTRHYFDLIRVAPAGVALMLIAYLVLFWFSPADERGQLSKPLFFGLDWRLGALIVFLFLIGFPAAAVRWHRFVLLGERPSGLSSLSLFWGTKETRYLWTWLKLSGVLALIGLVLVMLVMLAAMGGENVGGWHTTEGKRTASIAAFLALGIGCLALPYFVMRMSVAFPDAAIGQQGGIAKAWESTAGNAWRLWGYGVLVQFLAMAVTWCGGFAMGLVMGLFFLLTRLNMVELATKIAVTLTLPFMLFQLMAMVTMLSVAYREIVGLPADAAAELANEAAPA